MEKQITLTDIKGTFVKDFDTFSKMDPFLNFSIGKSQGKTETAKGAGKQPVWTQKVLLNYFDEPFIKVVAFEEDFSSNDLMGQGKIDVKLLKASGTLQIKIEAEQQTTGTITCNYTMKTLPPSPLLVLKNIKCDFYKETKFILKSKPYFALETGGKNTVTQVIKDSDGKLLHWKDQILRIKIKDGDKLNFIVYDKDDNQNKIFGYETTTKQFRTLTGHKCFNVIDKSYQPLGVIQFDYETQHLVNKQQSTKNQQAIKKQMNNLTLINIEKIKGKLNDSSQDIYFKINLGPNMLKTQYIENAKKDFVMELNKSFYAERKENKMVFAAYDKDLISDDILGSGDLQLENLQSGEKTVSLNNNKKEHFGDIILVLTTKKVVCKTIILSDIKVKLNKSADIIGQSEPYIIARTGGWSGRTETQEGQEVTFKKSINLKFEAQKQLQIEIWEEDVNQDDKIFVEKVKISALKKNGDMTIPLKSQKEKGGELYFKYTTQNVVEEKKDGKKSEKKIEPKKEPIKQVKKTQKQQIKDNNSTTNLVQSNVIKQSENQAISRRDHSINNSSNFKLPSIKQSRNYGDKIFIQQSVATLQNSIHAYSMPKANRFGYGSKYQGEPSYYMDTSFKPGGAKGVGFGFGNKRQFPEWMQKNMKENPAPGAYFDQHSTSPDFRPKGPTFGIGHKYYQKVTIPKEKSPIKTIQRQRLKPLYSKK